MWPSSGALVSLWVLSITHQQFLITRVLSFQSWDAIECLEALSSFGARDGFADEPSQLDSSAYGNRYGHAQNFETQLTAGVAAPQINQDPMDKALCDALTNLDYALTNLDYALINLDYALINLITTFTQ